MKSTLADLYTLCKRFLLAFLGPMRKMRWTIPFKPHFIESCTHYPCNRLRRTLPSTGKRKIEQPALAPPEEDTRSRSPAELISLRKCEASSDPPQTTGALQPAFDLKADLQIAAATIGKNSVLSRQLRRRRRSLDRATDPRRWFGPNGLARAASGAAPGATACHVDRSGPSTPSQKRRSNCVPG